MDDLDLVVGGGIYFGCSLLGTLEIMPLRKHKSIYFISRNLNAKIKRCSRSYLFISCPLSVREVRRLPSEWITSIFILLIIIIAIAQADAFHFNPVMRLLLGYRFYAAKKSSWSVQSSDQQERFAET